MIRCRCWERRELGMVAPRCKSASHNQPPTSRLTEPSHTRTFFLPFSFPRFIPTVFSYTCFTFRLRHLSVPALSSQMGGSQPGPGPGRPRS